MTHEIKHVWFDMNGTITVHTDEFNNAHDDLRYQTYAEVVGRDVDDALKADYEAAYKKAGSNSAVFTALGKPSDYWMNHFGQMDETEFYKPVPDVYETLDSLRQIVPISLFTNNTMTNAEKTLKVVNVDIGWFSHIISGDDIETRKPALDGFNLIIQKSGIPPKQILYVGDRVSADVIPAKSVGMLACLVYSESDEADFSFATLQEILSIF